MSSRDRVLPGEDADAAAVLEDVFRRRGHGGARAASRAQAVKRTGDGVVVTLADGRTVEGSHCLVAVGSIPNTAGLGLADAGVELSRQRARHRRPGVPRPRPAASTPPATAPACLPLASVAAMQGRIAM